MLTNNLLHYKRSFEWQVVGSISYKCRKRTWFHYPSICTLTPETQGSAIDGYLHILAFTRLQHHLGKTFQFLVRSVNRSLLVVQIELHHLSTGHLACILHLYSNRQRAVLGHDGC